MHIYFTVKLVLYFSTLCVENSVPYGCNSNEAQWHGLAVGIEVRLSIDNHTDNIYEHNLVHPISAMSDLLVRLILMKTLRYCHTLPWSSWLCKTFDISNISVTTEDIYLKLGLPKGEPIPVGQVTLVTLKFV